MARDEPEFARMLEKIDAYERGSIGFGALVADLEALNGALSDPPANWHDGFRSRWGVLEEVHAGMAYDGRSRLDELDRSLVKRSLAGLRHLVRAAIERPR